MYALQFRTNPSCLDLGVALQFQEYVEAAQNIMGFLHILTIVKGEGFHEGVECGWVGLPLGEKGAKIEVSAWVRARCRNLHGGIGRRITEMEILARFNGR